MKDKNYIIKVGDLLQEWGKNDIIEFDSKISSQLSNLSQEWISGTVILRSLNQDSLYISLKDVTCFLEETCDRCGSHYKRPVEINEYKARFVADEKTKLEEQETSDEEIFVINMREKSIDVEAMIAQAISLEDPFVKHCDVCEKELENTPDEEDIEEDFSWGGNIIFH